MDKEIIDSHFIFLFAFCNDNLDGFNILKGLFFNGSILLKFFICFFGNGVLNRALSQLFTIYDYLLTFEVNIATLIISLKTV